MSTAGGAGVARLDAGPESDALGGAFASREARPCPVCGARSGQARHTGEVVLRGCPCGVVYMDPLPRPSVIAEQEIEAFEGGLREETTEMFTAYYRDYPDDPVVRGFRESVEEIRRVTGGGRLVDVGIGTGLFLHLAREAGFAPLGVEISPACAARARAEFGVDVHVGDFESFEPVGPVDAVAMSDVLEHVADPRRFLAHAAAILRPGGALFVAVPCCRSTLFRGAEMLSRVPRVGALAGRFFAINHYTYFTRDALARIARECGFEPVWVRGASPYVGRYDFSPLVKLGVRALVEAGRWTGLEARAELLAVKR
ncbi:MAG: hypothetical protein RL698_2933 [Pseudomonadota bacterium]